MATDHLTTSFTRLVGCRYPIQQAGMGGVASPELAAAVASAGALGTLALHGTPAAEVAIILDRLRGAGPVGMNFLVPFVDESAVEAAAARCRVIEFFYGDPLAALVDRVHQGGALACWQVGSVDEASAAADAGCDLIVAQGVEAGGHVRGSVALLPLLEAILDRVDIPVLAAGGISTGRGLAAVLAMGAGGARIGTRFVACSESDGHPDYIAALLEAGGSDTTLTEAFGRGWPHAPHRVLQSCVDAASALLVDDVGTSSGFGSTHPVRRFAPDPPSRSTTGRIDAMALYAGQGVGAVRSVQSAAEIIRDLVDGAARLLGEET